VIVCCRIEKGGRAMQSLGYRMGIPCVIALWCMIFLSCAPVRVPDANNPRYVRNRWSQIREGMTRQEVKMAIGGPDRVEYSSLGEWWWYDYKRAMPGYVKFSNQSGRVDSFSSPAF